MFAGNVTSALRRHRSESEPDSPFNNPAAQELQHGMAGGSAPASASSLLLSNNDSASQFSVLERPKTPARVSITDTLDRANELETQKHKSRDAILSELKAWQQEGTVSQLGVTHVTFHRGDENSPPETTSKRKTSSRSKAAERRPNTSAGVLGNGASVKEAFVETPRHRESAASGTRAKTPALHHRSSFSALSRSTGTVDILILDEGDERRPCSPKKSSKGIFTTGSTSREWNFDALSPKLDLNTAESSWRNFPVPSPRESHQNDRMFQKTTRHDVDSEEDGDSSSSDNESK